MDVRAPRPEPTTKRREARVRGGTVPPAQVVQKYSNFVSFPIEVGGEVANGVGAVWTRDPREVKEEEYEAFYKRAFKGAWDTPSYHLHFRADAPLDVKCVLFLPSRGAGVAESARRRGF